MPFNIEEGFRIGQSTGVGGTGFESFIRTVNDRMEQQNKFKADVAGQVAVEKSTAPVKLESAIALEKAKSGMARENATAGLQGLKDVVGQGGFSPGSTLSYDPSSGETKYNIQLNPKLEQTENAKLAIVNSLIPELENLSKEVSQADDYIGVKEGPLSHLPGTLLQGSKMLPLGEDMRNNMMPTIERAQRIKSIRGRVRLAGFTFGGATLTKTEEAVTSELIDPTGKPKDLALQDIAVAKALLQMMNSAIQNGTNAQYTFDQLLEQARQQATTTNQSANISTNAASEAKQPAMGTPPDAGMQDIRSMAMQKLRERRTRGGSR